MMMIIKAKLMNSDESSEDEEEEFNPGDVIWAKHDRIWYPAQICCFE